MTQGTDKHKQLWGCRATMCELLALSLRYPDKVLSDAVSSGAWAEAALEAAQALELSLPQGFESDATTNARQGEAECLHLLRREATRLLVGVPEPVVSPYEGVWRADGGSSKPLLFVNPHSMDVERFCRACGLGRPAGTNEPLDHVATELELMQYLCMLEAGIAKLPEDGPALGDLPGGSAASAFGQFVDEHALVWMPRFASKLAVEAREPFFRAVASVLEAFLSSWQGADAE